MFPSRLLVRLSFALVACIGSSTVGSVIAEPAVPLPDHLAPEAFTAPGHGADAVHRRARPARQNARIVPGHLVVRFDDALDACVATAFTTPSDGAVGNLAASLRGLGAEAVRPVHRSADEQRTLRRGRTTIPLGELLAHHRRQAAELVGRRGLAPEKLDGLPAIHHVYTVELAAGVDSQRVIDALAADPRVRWAEPLRLYSTAALPDDPLVDPDGDGEWQSGSWGQDHADQWALEAMGWESVWTQRGTLWSDPARVGGGGVTIAVIDTGVDHGHQDLAANIWRDDQNRPGIDFVDIDVPTYVTEGYILVDGEDYSEPDHDPTDRQGHGSHVAGIAAAVADDGFGIAGVAWGATILPVRAGFAVGTDSSDLSATTGIFETDDLSAAIVWAAESGADILNFSFGGQRSQAISDAVAYAHGLGVLMVGAAGNFDDETRHHYPAAEPWVIAVGATDVSGAKAAFSNWGERLDLAAPGKDIVSVRAAGSLLTDDLVGQHHVRASGTSMATPQVAGALALILSARPAIDLDNWRGRLLATSQPTPRLLPGRRALLPLGAGTPDLWAAMHEAPRTHTLLTAMTITPDDPDFHDLGGNTTLGAGAAATLAIDLVNVWRFAGTTTFTLISDDPFVDVTSNPVSVHAWPQQASVQIRQNIVVAEDTPRYHRPDLRLHVTSGADRQEVTVPIEVNGSRSVELVPGDDNGYDYGFRLYPAVDGRVLATWTQYIEDIDRFQVRGAFFDLAGEPIGDSFVLHDEEDGVWRSDVAADRRDDGRWIAVWRRLVPLGDSQFDRAIEVQHFDADGQRLGDRLTILDDATQITQQLTVALADDGSAAVGWWGLYTNTYTSTRVQFLDPDGGMVGAIQDVQTFGYGSHSGPSFTFGPENRLLASWRAHLGRTPAGDHDINAYARLYANDGTPLGEPFPLNQERSRFNTNPWASASDDGFVVAWEWCDRPFGLGGTGQCSVRGRRVTADGATPGDELTLEPAIDHGVDDVNLIADSDGSYAVVWEACLPSGFIVGGCEIRARRFDAGDRPLGELFRVDALNPLHDPSLTRAGEDYLVSWSNTGYGPFSNWGQFFLFADAVAPSCAIDGDALCLQTERFEVRVTWQDFDGQTGTGEAQPLGGTSGYFSFFDPNNVEILVKVLDGRAVNGHWWVFTASLSNVYYRLEVRDTRTGATRVYENPAGDFASGGDVLAFADTESTTVRASRISRTSPKTTELLLHGRFQVEIAWRDFDDFVGVAEAVPLTDDSGAFWFFDSENVELVIKILDGRPLNGRWWVYFGALSNVAYTVTITDTETGTVRTYDNPLGTFASRGDVQAF